MMPLWMYQCAMPAEVNGYVALGEIPISTLLKKSEGTLQSLRRSDVWKHVQAFLPQNSSAFDSNKTLMQASYYYQFKNNDQVKAVMIRYHLLYGRGSQANNDQSVNEMVALITKLVLEQGINDANRLELQWAFAQGPWPSWTAEDQRRSSLEGAFLLLLDLVEITFQNRQLAWRVAQEISFYFVEARASIGIDVLRD